MVREPGHERRVTSRVALVQARLGVVPFEVALAVTFLAFGAAVLLGWGSADPVSALLPWWEADALAAMFLLAGAGTAAGVAGDKIAVEALGLTMMCGSLLARLLLYGIYLGPGPPFAVTGLFDVVFLVAAAARLRALRTRHIVIRPGNGGGGGADRSGSGGRQ